MLILSHTPCSAFSLGHHQRQVIALLMPLVWFFMAFLIITNSFSLNLMPVCVHDSCRSITSVVVSIPDEFSESSTELLNSSLFPNENIFPDIIQAYVLTHSFPVISRYVYLFSLPSHVPSHCRTPYQPKACDFAFWTAEFHPAATSPALMIISVFLYDISIFFQLIIHATPVWSADVSQFVWHSGSILMRATVVMVCHHYSHPLPPCSDSTQATSKTVFHWKIIISQKEKPVVAIIRFPWRKQ